MKLLLGFIVPFLLMCLPLVFQVIFTRKRLRHQTKLPLLVTFILSLAAGLFFPLLAFQIGTDALTADWPEDEPRCLAGFVLTLLLSYFIDVLGCMVIGIVGAVRYRKPASAGMA